MNKGFRFAGLAVAGLILAAPTANAMLIVNGEMPRSFAGYNGQPAGVTGTLSSGYTGTLQADRDGTVTFTYLGNESGDRNSFNFAVGGQALTESSALGTTISGSVGARAGRPGIARPGSRGSRFEPPSSCAGLSPLLVRVGAG